MNFRPLLLIAVAFGLLFFSRALAFRGDLAPIAEEGISYERATWHLAGLVMVIGALGCFISAGVSLFRR